MPFLIFYPITKTWLYWLSSCLEMYSSCL